MKIRIAALTFLLLLSACVSMSPRAERVHLYPKGAPLLQHCKRLGRISAEASGLGQINEQNATQQARNNLLDLAASRWPGRVDAVELISIDKGAMNFTAVGVAFNCVH